MSIPKCVFEKSEAEKVAVNYTPRKFPMTITPTAKDFYTQQSAKVNPSFRMNTILADHTGVAELERISLEEKVEQETLARIKELQENAYQEAYKLGLEEGRQQALQTHSAEIEHQMGSLVALMSSIEDLKVDLLNFNEAQLVKMVYHLANKLAMSEIQGREELILAVLKKGIEDAQSDEKVTIRVSSSDMQFLQKFQARSGAEFEFAKKLRIIESPDLTTGGCIIETNYGVVDASIEKRVENLWAALTEKLPKIKDTISTPDAKDDGS